MSVISLDFNKEPTNIHEIGLIDDVRILNLDYKKALFGNADKIIRHKNRIYLMDCNQTKSVIVYDTLGRFINLISKQGRGPNEYLQLTDIFIDTVDFTLNIVSRIDQKILKYDINGEQLLDAKKLPKSFTHFSKTSYGYVGYMGNYSEDRRKPYNLWTMSQKFILENNFFEIDKTWESTNLSAGSVFSAYQSTTYYITPMDYNIYAIGKGDISIDYVFDLGRYAWPVEYRDYNLMTNLRQNPANSYILRFNNFQETTNHLIVCVVHRGQTLLGIYDKRNANTHIAKLEPYTGKYFFSFGRIVGFDENTIYSLVEAPDIKRFWDGKDQYNDFESKYPEQIKNLRKKFEHIDENDNPFLVMYSIN